MLCGSEGVCVCVCVSGAQVVQLTCSESMYILLIASPFLTIILPPLPSSFPASLPSLGAKLETQVPDHLKLTYMMVKL